MKVVHLVLVVRVRDGCKLLRSVQEDPWGIPWTNVAVEEESLGFLVSLLRTTCVIAASAQATISISALPIPTLPTTEQDMARYLWWLQ